MAPAQGAEPTASSVIADIVDLARLGEASQDLPALGLASHVLTEKAIVPINDIESAYYLRVTVDDKPGVLSHITQILSDSGISLDAVLQKESEQHKGHGLPAGHVAVVLITNVIREASFAEAVNHIESLASVIDKVTFLFELKVCLKRLYYSFSGNRQRQLRLIELIILMVSELNS